MVYLRALRTIPNLSIHHGEFKTNTKSYPLANGQGFAEVIRSEEKGSDVNLVSYMLIDGMNRCYDVALVVSNDTDLTLPISLAREWFGVAVGVSAPVYKKGRRPMLEMSKVADSAPITKAHKSALKASQFPETVTLSDGGQVFRPQ